MLEMLAQTPVGLRVKCPLLLSDFNETSNVWRSFGTSQHDTWSDLAKLLRTGFQGATPTCTQSKTTKH
jgi:hypothetical protein